MKKLSPVIFIILFIISSFTQSLLAQENKKPTTFHRLLLFNAENELMVVKVKNADLWVTPGIYQNNHQFIKEGLDSLAQTFGISISRPKLKGIFTLKIDADQSISTRNIFVAKVDNGALRKPETIEKIKWLPVKEATDLITIPHINEIINQVTEHPNSVWSGGLLMYKENNEFRSKIIEDFYPVF